MEDFLKLGEKRILVTGASSGIGRETAIQLSRYGAKVIAVGRREDKLDDLIQELSGDGHKKIVFDLTDLENYQQLFSESVEDGSLDGLVHCAGIAKPVPVKMVSQFFIKETFDINFVSFMELMKYFTKRKISKGGSVVAVSALAAHSPRKCMSIYAASKGALESAVKSLAYELIDKNFRLNTVVPGPVMTPMAVETTAVYENNTVEDKSLGIAEPVDVANAILFLLSDVSRFVTGRNYYVDGGRLT